MSPVIEDPSESSCQDPLYVLFQNNNIRKLYNKTISSCRRLHQSLAKSWFLEKLIEEKVIPSYFKVKNKSHDNTSASAIQTSLEWMKDNLALNKEADQILANFMSDHLKELLIFIPEDLNEALAAKIHHRSEGFQHHYREEKLKRFSHLKNPPPKRDKNSQQQTSKSKRKWVKKSQYVRMKRKLKKQDISIVYNYSSITLTPAMESLFNRGLSFVPTPEKINFTQVLADLKYFERNMYWKEKMYDPEEEKEFKPGIFKEKKHNFPQKYVPPEALKTFIHATKSEICDPQNRNNNVKQNLPAAEKQALKQLIDLQNNRQITIKECDKGGGILILDTVDYLDSCAKHLKSTRKNSDGSESPYYREVGEEDLEAAKAAILNVLDDALALEIITKKEYEAMDPTSKGVGRFYQLFKLHKAHDKIPPERPIVSASGSITENLSHFVQHFVRDLATTHVSYLQDTPDLLRELDKLENIPDDAILLTIDVTALYTNIQKEDALKSMEKVLEARADKSMPTEFLLELLDLVLTFNIFEHDSQLYQQLIGVSMGTKVGPSVADIFMSFIDEDIKRKAMNFAINMTNPLSFFKRFLDDILMIWTGSYEDLHKFLGQINTIHPSIKFTMQHTKKISDPPSSSSPPPPDTCNCEPASSIPFLDASISVENGRIKTALYRKPCAKNQYLLPTSCHPNSVPANIPYSLALRLVCLHTDPGERDKSLEELRDMLVARGYKRKLIAAAIARAVAVPRAEAIKRVVREKDKDRVVLAIQFDPRLASIPKIVHKHHRTMVASDPHLAEVYKKPPITAFKRPPNLRNKLIRSKVPPPPTSARGRTAAGSQHSAAHPRPGRDIPSTTNLRPKQKGMRKCRKPLCETCDFVQEGKTVKLTATGKKVEINDAVSCESTNYIYLISCKKERCRLQYIGKSKVPFRTRMGQHRNYVSKNMLHKATGEHFNRKGHKIADMSMTILEKVHSQDAMVLSIREEHWIRQGNTKYRGINRNRS